LQKKSGFIQKISKVLTFWQLSDMSKKIVVRVDINCEKCKRRAMETIAGVEGVDSIAVDVNKSEITVIGDADPVNLTESLRAFGLAQLVSVGPAKEPEKKPDEKKPDDKKAAVKKPDPNPPITYCILPPGPCDPCNRYTYYWSDENPNSCSIM